MSVSRDFGILFTANFFFSRFAKVNDRYGEKKVPLVSIRKKKIERNNDSCIAKHKLIFFYRETE